MTALDVDEDAAARGRALLHAGAGCATVMLLHGLVVGAAFALGALGTALSIDWLGALGFGTGTYGAILIGGVQLVYVLPLAVAAAMLRQRAYAAGVAIGAALTLLLNGCAAVLIGGSLLAFCGYFLTQMN